MDLTDIINAMKEHFHPGSTAMRIAPGETVGPSVSRLTRVPIQYRPNLGDGISGQMGPRFDLNALQMLTGNKPVIKIDPTSSDFHTNYDNNVNPVLKHEITHSVLEGANLSDEDYEALATKNPYYSKIAPYLASRGGYSPAEVPAYVQEPGAATRYGIPQSLIDLYRSTMLQQLQQRNPAMATRYRQSGPTQ